MHPINTLEADHAIAVIARAQLGLFRLGQARAAGVRDNVVLARVRAGTATRVFPAVYALRAVDPSPFQRTLGAALTVEDSIVAGRSAGAVLGLPVQHEGAIELIVAKDAHLGHHRAAGLATAAHPSLAVDAGDNHRCDARRPRTFARSRPARSLPRSCPCASAHDGRSRPVGDRCEVPRRDRGAAHFVGTSRRAWRRSAASPQPIGEMRVQVWLRRLGLVGAVPNLLVDVGGQAEEIDFGWVAPRVGLEVSPFFTHGSAAQQAADARKRRRLGLADWRIVEATDADLSDFEAFLPTARVIATHLGVHEIGQPTTLRRAQ